MNFFKSRNTNSNNVPKRDSKINAISSDASKQVETTKTIYTNENENLTELNSSLTQKIEDENKKTHEQLFSKTYFKPTIGKKLTIVLIENTSKVVAEKEKLIRLIKRNIETSGLVSIINYDSTVKKSKIFNAKDFNDITFLSSKNIDNETCLFDALVELENLVCDSYMEQEEKENTYIRINDIRIIGIGTCTDSCSKVSKEFAINCFYNVVRKPNVTSKYFCFTEESFIKAAEIGFHSIGAIFRNYQ